MFTYIESDAGRSLSAHTDETDDCAVRALAVAFPMPYDVAHDLLREGGRKDREGTIAYKTYQKLGFASIKYRGKKTKHKFRIIDLTVGRWIVEVKDHVYPVVDGIVYDELDERASKISYVWLVR